MLRAAEWSCVDCCFTSRCHRALQLSGTVCNCCLSMLAGDKKLQPVPNDRKENSFYMPVQRQAHATYYVHGTVKCPACMPGAHMLSQIDSPTGSICAEWQH